jgi:cell division protein FtsN
MKLITNHILFYIILFLSYSSLTFSQMKRWITLSEDDMKETLVDTTSIKVSDDQVSAWILNIYSTPQNVNNEGLMAKRARTQYLFNIAQNTYSVIGNLYYDEVGKIISQTYNPRIGGVGRSFSQKIKDDEEVQSLYVHLTSFLDIAVQESENDDVTPDNSLAEQQITTPIIEPIENDLTDEQNIDIEESKPDELTSKDENTVNEVIENPLKTITFNRTPEIPDSAIQRRNDRAVPSYTRKTPTEKTTRIAQIYDPVSGDYLEIKSKEPEKKEEVQLDLDNYIYDYENETRVTNTIFNDGKVYCFQVSSWKRESIADNEVRKLKRKGHNAFVTKGQPNHKRGTWYRVRIGNFESKEEAEEYKRNM